MSRNRPRPHRAHPQELASGPHPAWPPDEYSSGDTADPRPPRDYDYRYAGSVGEWDQDEFGGDMYGGGRYGAGPYEQSQRFGEGGFESHTGDFGLLQRQYENRYASTPEDRDYGANPGGAYSASAGGGYAPGRGPLAHAGASRSARPRGPKGYTRTDERIREDICERLSQPLGRFGASDLVNEHLDVSDVSVQVDGAKVVLEGTVPERRMKHEIEDIVDACPGVQDIDNRITVRR